MKKNRLVRLFCIAMATLFCLTACGDTNANDVETTPGANTAEPTVVTTAPITPEPKPEDEWVSAIFGGGPFVNQKRGMEKVKNRICAVL